MHALTQFAPLCGFGRRILFAALLGAAPAYAAADVLLYGYVDLGLIKESGAATRLDRGLNNWLGVRGTEDLGGGNWATFNVQMRFNPDTGMQERASTLFQGETTVGLKNNSAGQLRVGRALSPLWQEKWLYDPWYDSGFMGSLESYNGDFNSDGLPGGDFHNYSRVGNSVFYTSPAVAGFTVHGMAEVELADGAPSRSRGAALNYAGGPVTALLAVERNHVGDDIGYLAGSWRSARLTLIGAYSRTHFAAVAAAASAAPMRSVLLAATYGFNMDTLRVGYGRLRDSGNHKYSVGYNHALSKRTNLYGDLYRETIVDGRNGLALGLNHTF
ncbi:putative porin [Oxalobacteraceae bacterium GrIS 1.11]